MTFIIPENTPVPARRGPDIAPSTNAQAMGAAARDYLRSVNAFMQRQRQVVGEQDALAAQAMARLGPQGMKPIIEEFNRKTVDLGLPERTIPEDASPDDIMGKLGANGSKAVLEAARAAALADPEAWADIDISPEGIEARVTERRKADAQADADLIAMSPNPTRSSIIGSLAGGLVDPVNLALMPFGLGGGSILRIMGREAMLGAAAEGIQYPTATKVAAELDQQAPDLVESLAMGAAGGAIIGGAIEGVPRAIRALTYYRGIKTTKAPAGISPATHEAAIQKAEEALVAGTDPLQAVREVLAAEPMPRREPLILTPDMSVTARTPEPTPLAPDPITTQSLPPIEGQAPTTPGETAALAEKAIRKAAPRGKKPTDLSTFVVRSGGIWKGDDRGDLAAMDYKRPGFLKANKFVRSAAGDNGGGRTIEEMREAAAQAGYLPMESTVADFLDALDGDVRGSNKRYALGEAATVKDDFDPDYKYDPQEAYLSMEPRAAEFFVDLNARQFDDPDWEGALERDFDGFVAGRGVSLLPRERDEILSVLKQRGGDGADLIDRALSRELDEAEYRLLRQMRGEPDARATDDIPFGDPSPMAASASGADPRIAGEPQAAAGNAPEPGAGSGGVFSTEQTDAGVQSIIPGIEAVTTRARLEAKQIARLSGGSQPVDIGLFDIGARDQMDMFSDPASPSAKAAQASMIESLRDDIERGGDLKVDLGAGPTSARALLRELDDEIDFEAILDACGKRRTE